MKEKKHNYFYRITNQINWKYYFGIHSTDNLNDNYFGSGKILKDAIKKHGIDNFHLTIIQDYPTRKEASDHEKRVVTSELIELDECYNCKTGGDNECFLSVKSLKKISNSLKRRYENMPSHRKGSTTTSESKKKISEAIKGERNAMFGLVGELSPNWGRKLSDEVKAKMSESQLGKTLTFEHIENIKIAQQNRDPNTRFTKKCQIDEIEYKNVREASEKLNLDIELIRNRIRSKDDLWSKWIYLSPRSGNQGIRIKCIINGIVYKNAKEASRNLNVSDSTVRNRLASNHPKWKEWQYFKE